MKTKLLFILLLLAVYFNVKAQNENSDLYLNDTSFTETFTRNSGDYAPYGKNFTPHGTFRILVVYAGFYTPGVYDQEYPLSIWPTEPDIIDPNHLSVPTYAQSGTPSDILFSNVSQLSDPQYANTVNLTRYYYEMSQSNFILLGDVFKDPDPSSSTYGDPIRINIDPTGCTTWMALNQKVLNKIAT